MSLTLRPYQKDCLARSLEYYKMGVNRQLAVLSTGLGKTAIAANLRAHFGFTKKVLFAVHMETLATQAASAMKRWNPELRVGVEMAGSYADLDGIFPPHLIVASIPTLGRKGSDRIKRFDPFEFDAVIQDEAHLGVADSFKRVYDHFGLMQPNPDGLLFLGITATPNRSDGQGLRELFDAIVFDMGIQKGIEQGWLCDIRGIRVNGRADLDKVKVRAGEFAQDDLEKAVNTPQRNAIIVKEWYKHAYDRRTIAFTVDVQHALDLAEAFKAHGIEAKAVWGDDPERYDKIQEHQDGKYPVTCCAQLLGIGYDDPKVNCIVLSKPMKSFVSYAQCLDSETEILTPDGWKGRGNITIGDPVYSFDLATSEVRQRPALAVYDRMLGDGEHMYSIESPTLELRVTAGHRMVYRTRVGRKKIPSEWKIDTAESLGKRTYEYHVPLCGFESSCGLDLTDDEIRFIGWYLTDGTRNRKTDTISICQADHQPQNAAIISCLEGCGFSYKVYRGKRKADHPFNHTSDLIRYTVSRRGGPKSRDRHLGWSRLEKYIDKDFSPLLNGLNRKQFAVLLEAIHLGDGFKQLGQNWTRRSYHIVTGRKTFADRIQSLCVRRGFKCNIAFAKNDYSGVWIIHIKDTQTRTVGGISSTDRPILSLSKSNPKEFVWCVENADGTLIIRRNGKVSIVGNCVGRGTRIAEGKSDCLIIDVGDNTSRHNLCSVSTLLGLPKDLDLKGEKYTVAKKQLDRIASEFPQANVHDIKSLSELKSIAESVHLFQPQYPAELNRLSELKWRKNGEDSYMLAVDRASLVTVQKNLIGEWDIRGWIGDKKIEMGSQNLPGALNLADHIILSNGGVKSYLSREARWHSDPPTDKQVELCMKLGIYIPAGATRGSLSIAIDNKLNAKRIAKA